MSGQSVTQLVSQLLQAKAEVREQLEELLGAQFQLADENDHWSFYKFELPEGPFAAGEYRVNRAGDRVLLSLTPRDPASLAESDIELSKWGEVRNIDISPRIPPEGTDTLVYEVNGVQLRFQFTHRSRTLRTLSLTWEPQI